MSEAKFKCGDKVSILDGSQIRNYTHGRASRMNDMVGMVSTVESAINTGPERIGYRLEGTEGFVFDERGLKLVQEQLIIYRKGDKTIGILKEDGKEVRRAIAKCGPEDMYMFKTGAEIILERLYAPQAYSHKLVCIKGSTFFKKGKIYEMKDGVICGDGYDEKSIGAFSRFTCLDDVNRSLSAQFIELAEA